MATPESHVAPPPGHPHLDRKINRSAHPAPGAPTTDTLKINSHHASHHRRASTAAHLGDDATRLQEWSAALDGAEKILGRMRALKELDLETGATGIRRERHHAEFDSLKDKLTLLRQEAFERPGSAQVRADKRRFDPLLPPAEALAELEFSAVEKALGAIRDRRAENKSAWKTIEVAAARFATEKATTGSGTTPVSDSQNAAALTAKVRHEVLAATGSAMRAQANQSARLALRLLG